jgi:medium-chain acyl-[acyl-carrier-protein] hydrolase
LFTELEKNSQANMRLFCFPYAGGGATIYYPWRNMLPPGVEIVASHLPGRGTRLHETPFIRLEHMVEALGEGIISRLDKPFAFFGHSMGAMIGFELARLLRNWNCPQPVRLFVSGQRAPHLRNDDPITYNLPDAEFIKGLSELRGTPKEVLANRELMEIMLPILRADFAVVETYAYTDGPPLDCPIVAFGGLQDVMVTREDLRAWRYQTSGSFSMRVLPGNHFFLHSHQHLLLSMLYQELFKVAANSSPTLISMIH